MSNGIIYKQIDLPKSDRISFCFQHIMVKRKTEEESNAVNDGKNIILKLKETDLETIIVNL